MKTIPAHPAPVWIYLFILGLGYSSMGWLLAAFQVPGLVWLGTLGVTMYLAEVGIDAIALSSAWVAGVVSAGAVTKAWTPVWNGRLPYENAKLWAGGLLGLWGWAVVLVVLLAFASAWMQTIGLRGRRAASGLVALTWLALGCGWLINRLLF
ncbi:hypothetical protein IFO70_01405 [Phormidium tenue FACHB-886]|nr:hypothetical protein [Phormidium tenue FACHB-886]